MKFKQKQPVVQTAINNALSGGGGTGGTTDYTELENKPSINGVTLSGNKTASDLGLISAASLFGEVLIKDEVVTFTNSLIVASSSDYATTSSIWTDRAIATNLVQIPSYTESSSGYLLFCSMTPSSPLSGGTYDTFYHCYASFINIPKSSARLNPAGDCLQLVSPPSDGSFTRGIDVLGSSTAGNVVIIINKSSAVPGKTGKLHYTLIRLY